MVKRVVVIGGGAAGSSAAARARRLDPEAEVTLVERTGMITHAPCGIPYAISGLVPSYRMLRTYSPERFASERRIRVLTNATVTSIDVDGKRVEVSLGDGRTEKLSWDSLVIATGAKPLIPRGLEGVEDARPVLLRHPEDVVEAQRRLSGASRVAVLGGGYIGVEAAEALVDLGKKVTLYEMMDRLLPTAIDGDVSRVLEESMQRSGVDLRLGQPVRALRRRSDGIAVITDAGEEVFDEVVMGLGVRPNADLAVSAGVRLGATGAVETDEFMRTNLEGVFAAGDLVEKHHLLLWRKVWIPLAPAANKEGQVAGANAVVPRSLRMRGIVGTAVTKFRNTYVARTGLSETEARANGFNVESTLIKARTKAGYYPGGVEVTVKMVVQSKSGRLLGVQVVGDDPVVAGYADVAATAITAGFTIEDLFFTDIGYMPATAPVWHPLIVAARTLSGGRF
ncbi:MAG: FAD-dependent oxidoreductase [Aigarchaeota archaeon]|nr:FAD-dependent oxidoreductase [Candidatus Calditenuis fumarioli]